MTKQIVFIIFALLCFVGYAQETEHLRYKESYEFWFEENDELVLDNIVRYYNSLSSAEEGSFATEIRCPKNILKEGATYLIPDTNFVFYIITVDREFGNVKKMVTAVGEIRLVSYTNSEITIAVKLTEPTGRVIDKTMTFQKRE